jgi:hypothetical protein
MCEALGIVKGVSGNILESSKRRGIYSSCDLLPCTKEENNGKILLRLGPTG